YCFLSAGKLRTQSQCCRACFFSFPKMPLSPALGGEEAASSHKDDCAAHSALLSAASAERRPGAALSSGQHRTFVFSVPSRLHFSKKLFHYVWQEKTVPAQKTSPIVF
ncbi:hypothetical protein, partial [Bacteroides fragilis]|uniref:hypothetical protein n=1 Tax=Bacteroides fragilis TaxID=817 RepID=UPI001FBA7D65